MQQPQDPPAAESAGARETATPTRYVVLACLCLAATIAYVGRNCMGVASDAVREDMGISLDSMGWVLAAFFWGYALAQIPCGWFAHIWGARAALSAFALTWSLACAALGTATGFWSLIAFQLLFGIAQAGIFPCSAAVISGWLPVSRRAFASGSLGSFMSIGGAIGAAVTGLAVGGLQWGSWSLSPIGWRWAFVLYALPGVVWAAWFYVWFRDRPQQHAHVNDAELRLIRADREDAGLSDSKPAAAVPWLAVLGSFDMWMIFAQQFFRAAGYIFFATWFPTYLKETRGVTTAASGVLTALPLLGVVAGGIVGGLVVDLIWNATGSRRLSRQAVAVAAMLACAAFIAAAYFVAQAIAAVLLISLGSFCAALAGSCGYTVTIEKAGRHVAPIFGAMNMSGNLGAALCPLAVAWLVTQTETWEPVLIMFAAIYVAAAICWALLDPDSRLERVSGE